MIKKVLSIALELALLSFSIYGFYVELVSVSYLNQFERPIQLIFEVSAEQVMCKDWSWLESVANSLPTGVYWDHKVTIGIDSKEYEPFTVGHINPYTKSIPDFDIVRPYLVLTELSLAPDLDCSYARFVFEKELLGTAYASKFFVFNPDYFDTSDAESYMDQNMAFIDGMGLLYVLKKWDGTSMPTCEQLIDVEAFSRESMVIDLYPEGVHGLRYGISYLLHKHGCIK